MMNLWNLAKESFKPSSVGRLSPTEIHVFVAVLKLGNQADALSTFEEARKTSPEITLGSVYTTLEKMTWKGYFETELGKQEPSRGGRARKSYRATDRGNEALAETKVALSASRPFTARGKRKLQESLAALSSVHHS